MMTSAKFFVLEFGYKNLPGTKEEHWVSKGFYSGYEPNGGPAKVVATEDEAYHFPNQEFAENVKQGDDRFKSSRVVPAQS